MRRRARACARCAHAGRRPARKLSASVRSDTKWIIRTIAPAILVVTALLSMEIGGVSARIDNMDGRLERIEMNVCGMDVRLHSDEIVFGKGDQRLETLERAILPTASP